MMKNRTQFIAKAAVIAATYAMLTLALAPLSFGSVQLRLSEAMVVLAYFSPSAVVGLTLGCAVANIWSPFGIIDIVFGSLATLLAATTTYFLPKRGFFKFLAPLPSVIFNALIIGGVITVSMGTSDSFAAVYITNCFAIALPQTLVCYVAGLPLLLYLDSSGLSKKLL